MASRVMLADNKPITDEVIQRHLDEAGFLWGQPKIDGMRVYIGDNLVPQSRSGKEWKNKPMRAWAQDHPSFRGLDGEVVPGHTYHADSFREAMSGTRREHGSREFTFYAFDHTTYAGHVYQKRLSAIRDLVGRFSEFQESVEYHCRLVVCPTTRLETLQEVHDFEEQMILDAWEGSMLRRPDRAYKFGRSTNRGGELIKLKRYEDAEAIVVGYEAWKQNNNEPEQSPLGYQVRSSHQEGKKEIERLGAWKVELLTDRSVAFSIGVMQGVTHEDRNRMWQNREDYIGKILKFKFQGYEGGYDKPRQPVFLNWRSSSEF
jgi:DNA ligase 1